MHYHDHPLSFAHRGASHEAPANTLAAFRRAFDLGADGIEFDVQLSKDGQVVVIHDFSVDATTDGHGLVCEKTLAELKALDAGIRFDPTFVGERIPTLQELIEAIGHHLLLNIELKTTSLRGEGLAEAVVPMIEDNHLLDRVVVSSFNPLAIRRVRRLNPSIPIGLLCSLDQPIFLRRAWFRHLVQPEALHPNHVAVGQEYMRWAKKRDYRVHVWTADDPNDMRQLMQLGVDIIITNRPDLLRDVLQANQEE